MNIKGLSLFLLAVALSSSNVFAQNFFWSNLGFEQGAVEDDLMLDAFVGDTGTAFLYYAPSGQDIETGFDLAFEFSVSGIAGFSAAETFQADIVFDSGTQQTVINNRWSTAAGGSFGSALVTENVVTNFAANSIPGFDGLQVENIPLSNGIPETIDSLYDVNAEAFLIGSFSWEAISPGSTSIGPNEISGQIVDTVGDISDSFSFNSVTINVKAIPEVTSTGLLTMGMFGFMSRRRRQTKAT